MPSLEEIADEEGIDTVQIQEPVADIEAENLRTPSMHSDFKLNNLSLTQREQYNQLMRAYDQAQQAVQVDADNQMNNERQVNENVKDNYINILLR